MRKLLLVVVQTFAIIAAVGLVLTLPFASIDALARHWRPGKSGSCRCNGGYVLSFAGVVG